MLHTRKIAIGSQMYSVGIGGETLSGVLTVQVLPTTDVCVGMTACPVRMRLTRMLWPQIISGGEERVLFYCHTNAHTSINANGTSYSDAQTVHRPIPMPSGAGG